LTDPYSR